MKSIMAIVAVMMMPILILNWFGGIVGGIWLIRLGIWEPIIVSVAVLFFGVWGLGFILMPSIIFALPAAKAAERGRIGMAVFVGLFSVLYTMVVMVIWSFLILKAYSGMGPSSAQWPLLLLSYGAATGPWTYMAAQEQRASGNLHSAGYALSLSIGYIIAILGRQLGGASFEACLWMLSVPVIIGVITESVLGGVQQGTRNASDL